MVEQCYRSNFHSIFCREIDGKQRAFLAGSADSAMAPCLEVPRSILAIAYYCFIDHAS